MKHLTGDLFNYSENKMHLIYQTPNTVDMLQILSWETLKPEKKQPQRNLKTWCQSNKFIHSAIPDLKRNIFGEEFIQKYESN